MDINGSIALSNLISYCRSLFFVQLRWAFFPQLKAGPAHFHVIHQAPIKPQGVTGCNGAPFHQETHLRVEGLKNVVASQASCAGDHQDTCHWDRGN